MSKVQIQGLNHRQRAIADVLWLMNGKNEVEAFIKALHPSMRAEAEVVVDMMIYAVLDEIETVDPETTKLLDKYK
jgi:hypothetical protein